MSIDTITYARDKEGKLATFKVSNTSNYTDTIAAVKAELGVDRALCLVLNKPLASEEPIPNEEAVA